MNIKEPKSRIARQQQFLSQFDFEIIHKKGSLHSNANAMSRRPLAVNAIETDHIALLQKRDVDLHNLMYFLKHGNVSPNDNNAKVTIAEAGQYFLDEKEVLYHISRATNAPRHKTCIQLVIPKEIIGEILSWIHESPVTGAHLGIEKFLDKILKRYFWKNV